ncbi:MAG: hypothetical protein U0Q14_04420 [Dermatophilaceae bacterium]|jgi:hypothetical protein|nr:hypothetical protein [Candidatus Lutibacillus vidarii]HON74777.1 hypothetical protein [Dermatophilaceae bacterium]HRB98881.1 hypothetical protein [Dermatophilaceae bacterium]
MTDRPAGLLPSLAAGSAADRRLREQLTVLASSVGDDRVRRDLRAVLDGRASLRALALSGHFADALAPLVERGMRDYVEPHGLAALELAEQAERELAADRAGSAG